MLCSLYLLMNRFLISQKENVRRKHNYLPLIMGLLKALAEEGKLSDLVKQLIDKNKAKAKKPKQ